MSNRHALFPKSELPAGKARAVEVEGRTIAVFNVGGVFYALDDTCPHANAPLSEGEVCDGQVLCPFHGAPFDLQTGAVLGPPAHESVRVYPVHADGDTLQIEI
jgi:3-phenylpropionate/trans-cinnamate dioxygenase ferredoxin subunit